MHELAIAQAIVEAVDERRAGARVKRVVVEVGSEAAVVAEALQFCFEAAVSETDMRGAVLEIVAQPGDRLFLRRMEVE